MCSLAPFSPTIAQPTAHASPDWAAVEQALGRKGMAQPGNVIKFGFPRSDLQVVASGLTLKAALALGSWVAFGRAGTSSMVMGDLVLLEDEVGPVMRKLQEGGVEQTALHNHVLSELPRVMYMHIAARGNAKRIAESILAALALTKTPLDAPAATEAGMTSIDLDTAVIARTLGVSGKVNGGVYQVSVPRAERVMQRGMEVPPSMGVATAINFQPMGGGKAAITGDFVMTAEEVNPVIRALTSHGIAVTALHSHMLEERPRLFFMHFWAIDDAAMLADGLRAAIDRMNVMKAAR
ncbi:MAG: DUF1259 domain-containing protein [Gemmatimonadota bacterium]|nr:DUF1259 domain-containing protein [Gemmatimonadota bacterium]